MADTTFQVTQGDIDNLSTKLDEFAQVLNDRERKILYALFELAGKEIQDSLTQNTATSPEKKPTTPPTSLSAGFHDAFKNGIGAKFTISEDGTEAEGIKGEGKIQVSEPH